MLFDFDVRTESNVLRPDAVEYYHEPHVRLCSCGSIQVGIIARRCLSWVLTPVREFYGAVSTPLGIQTYC